MAKRNVRHPAKSCEVIELQSPALSANKRSLCRRAAKRQIGTGSASCLAVRCDISKSTLLLCDLDRWRASSHIANINPPARRAIKQRADECDCKSQGGMRFANAAVRRISRSCLLSTEQSDSCARNRQHQIT